MGRFWYSWCNTAELRGSLYGDSQLDGVVWGMNQILFCAQILFRRLHRSVARQQLNLLKLAATGAAKFGAGAAEVMRGDAGDAGYLGIGLDELPYDLLA